jgi:peptidoglycan hydrolase CwlO-like protein
MKAIAAAVLTLLASQPASSPAALAVEPKTCGAYAGSHVLVRQDVLVGLNDAEKNLPAAEAALAQAQVDLRDLKAAAEDLQRQKTVLLDHVSRLESVIEQQKLICELSKPNAADMAAEAWEWADAPLAFGAGAAMCVGIAFSLNEVSR